MRASILVILILTLGFALVGQDLSNIEIYNTSNSEINYNQINCIEFDNQNRMWIGTPNGLTVYDIINNNWSSFNSDILTPPWCCFPSQNITTMEWANSLSTMYMGTTNGIISFLDEGGDINDFSENYWMDGFGASCNTNSGIINAILYEDRVWAGSTEGLCIQFLGGEGGWLLQNTETGFYSNNFRSIQKNINNDEIAIGTMNGGLITYNGEFNNYYSDNSDILDNTVLDAVFDQNNNIIICTPQAGLGVLTENESWVWFNTVNSNISSNSLQNVVVDTNNDLWITTLENGLIHYKNGVFYNYNSTNSNLPDNKINCLKFDSYDNLWLGTDTAGLIKINNPLMSNHNDNQPSKPIYTHFINDILQLDLKIQSYITVMNMKGQLIYNKFLTKNQSLNTSDLKSGIYFISVRNTETTYLNKIVKY